MFVGAQAAAAAAPCGFAIVISVRIEGERGASHANNEGRSRRVGDARATVARGREKRDGIGDEVIVQTGFAGEFVGGPAHGDDRSAVADGNVHAIEQVAQAIGFGFDQ